MNAIFAILSVLAISAAAAPKASKLGFRNLYHQPIKTVKAKPNPRIIGGREATPHSLPYQAFIEITDIYSQLWYCGGTLISPNYVLTAAHCLENALDSTIILGLHKPSEKEPTQLVLETAYFKRHEEYGRGSIYNDIALIRLQQTVRPTDAIKTIIIPSDPSNQFAGSLAVVSGWGINNNTQNTLSDALNYLTLSVITNQFCEEFYDSLPSSVLCTAPEDHAGICAGDSGGPLVTESVLIGVAAFTAPGCVGYPAGFTRITSYIDWIKENSDL